MTYYTDLRTGIKAQLDAIQNIGLTHNRERFVVDPSAYLDMFKTTIGGVTQIRAWLILRESVTPIEDRTFGEDRRRHLFVLRGYLGFQDASDTYGTMQALCDTVMATFDALTTMSVAGVIVRQIGPTTLRSFETGQFGSVLAHVCEIEVPIDVLVTIGSA